MHLSVIKSQFGCLCFLLNRDPELVNCRDAQQTTPLIVAAQWGDEMVRHCLTASAAKTPHLPCALPASVAETLPPPCVFHRIRGQETASALCVSPHSPPRQRLLLPEWREISHPPLAAPPAARPLDCDHPSDQQSMQQTWTVGQHAGPNRLGCLSNQAMHRCVRAGADPMAADHLVGAARGPALRCVLVCTHEIFTKGRSIFSRSTENGPAFP